MAKEIAQKNMKDQVEAKANLTRKAVPIRRMQLSGTVASDKMKDTVVVTDRALCQASEIPQIHEEDFASQST